MHAFEDIMGVTTSLTVGAKNFIIHFRGQADEEWNSQSQREAFISKLAERYKQSEARTMQVFAIGSKNLQDYITTEKDLARKICKMPTVEFLVQGGSNLDDTGMEFGGGNDDDFMTGDDWLLVDAAPKK
jgi:hypothetical protein